MNQQTYSTCVFESELESEFESELSYFEPGPHAVVKLTIFASVFHPDSR